VECEDSLDEIFRRIYRFNNRVPAGNYSEEFNEMKEVAVISVGVDNSFYLAVGVELLYQYSN